MKKTGKFSVIAASALALTALFGLSANADSRHRDESSWRESQRHDRYDRDGRRGDRESLRGVVERVDYRRGLVVLRTNRSGRGVVVEMVRQRGRGIDLDDIRRGDVVTFVGDWSRGGFVAWRIDDVDSGRRGNRRR
jgi:hypothetical protein